MVRKWFWLLGLWAMVSSFVLADGFREQFRAAFKSGDLGAAEQVLTAWERADARDPDLYVARFNLLLSRADRAARPAAGATASSATSKPVGSAGPRYDPALMAQAAAALQKGIALAPDRLDMRLGLAKSYEMTGQAALLLRTLREALAARGAGGKPWRWRDGAALPAPEEVFVPAAIEPFASNYWKQPGDSGLENGRPVAELLEQYFPQNSLGYFNMGVYYAHLNKSTEAYEKMQQADALQPKDFSTLMNLSKLAIALKHKAEATKYLDRLRQLPNGTAAAASFVKDLEKL